MRLCYKNHSTIAYESMACPLCDSAIEIDKYQREIEQQRERLNELDDALLTLASIKDLVNTRLRDLKPTIAEHEIKDGINYMADSYVELRAENAEYEAAFDKQNSQLGECILDNAKLEAENAELKESKEMASDMACMNIADNSALKQENDHLHLANQGIHHYSGCSKDCPCVRCQRDELKRKLEEAVAALEIISNKTKSIPFHDDRNKSD